MRSLHIFLLLILSVSLLLNSCSDEPSSIGINLVGSDYITVKTLDSVTDSIAQSSSYFKNVIPLGTSEWILIGKYQNTTTSTLMKFVFSLPDSLKTDVLEDNLNVTSSWIVLRYRYTYGDTLASMMFNVHKVNSPWSYSSFTIDSLSKLQYDYNNVSSNFSINDTSYTFDINNSLPLAWMKNAADNTLESNFGIYLAPFAYSNKVVGFQALTAFSTQAAKLYVVIEKQGAYVDTINGYIAADISLVDSPLPNLPSGLMCVQSGVAVYSKLKFNIDSLPPGLVINKAELFITADSINSIVGSSYNNSLKLYYLQYADSLNTQGSSISLLYSDNVYSGDITTFVRTWYNRKENFGMLIQTGNQTLGLDLLAMKGSDYSEFSERPRIKIIYTQQQNK